MSYRFKGPEVIIEGDLNKIVPQSLPVSPVDGQLVVDSSDKKLKVWNVPLSRWIILGDADDMRFDSTTTTPSKANGFIANNVQEAIEEARTVSASKARFAVSAGFDGTASTGRWLEFNSNVDSNQAGFVLARDSKLREIAVALNTSGTVTFQIRKKDNTVLTSVSLSAERIHTVTGLSVALAANLELMIYTSSGSGARPIVWLFIEPD